MRVIPASTYRRMPWKNGGGETVEIAVSPEGASLDTFDWRVSMARVDAPGPFSLFPGVDRTLAVLDGAAMVLRFAAGRTVTLTTASDPLVFAADVPVEADLPAGGITDLNVMTRRDHVRHALRRLPLEGPTTLTRACDEMLLLVRGAGIVLREDGVELDVADGDTVRADGPAGGAIEIDPQAPAMLYIIELWR